MRHLLIGAAVAALCLVATPTLAASAETEAFIANARLGVVFLARSSELAADRSESTDLRSFAGHELAAQDAIAFTLERRTAPDVAQAVPMAVASNDVMTGRSAALDVVQSEAEFAPPVGTGALMPAAMITLDHLAASKGQAFDSLYKTTQVGALRQLAALYNAYSMTGDDAALKQLAKTELASTNERIAELARF